MKRNQRRILNASNYWKENKHEIDQWSFKDWLRREYGIEYDHLFNITVYDTLKYSVFVLKFG